MKTLLLTQPMPAAPFAAAIEALLPGFELAEYRSAMSDAELASFEAVLAWQMPAALPARLTRLRWVCAISAGVDKLLPPDLAPHVRLSRIVDREQAAGIAQFVLAMALRHARQFELYERQALARDWLRHPLPMARHRTAVLGTGAMGGEIAAWLERAGLEVEGWNRRSPKALAEVLATSRIVVCALPLTAETDGVLDARAFAAMPKGAYVINVARGAHVVEADLIAAVQSGHLSGAALDVQRTEPLPPGDPLWNVPGITVTPHIAAQSSVATIAGQFADGVRALADGVALPNEVDRARGY